MPESRQWVDRFQPQTLQMAVMLSYMFGVLSVLSLLLFGLTALPSLVLIAIAACAYGIANEKRAAYQVAIVLAGIYALIMVGTFISGVSINAIINVIFAGALFALLIHPQSRNHQRIYFH